MDALETRADPADLTFERFRAAMEGGGKYPKGAVFVDAEASFAGSALLRNMREGLPVVLVYPDGVEKIVVPFPEAKARWRLIHAATTMRSKLLSLF